MFSTSCWHPAKSAGAKFPNKKYLNIFQSFYFSDSEYHTWQLSFETFSRPDHWRHPVNSQEREHRDICWTQVFRREKQIPKKGKHRDIYLAAKKRKSLSASQKAKASE